MNFNDNSPSVFHQFFKYVSFNILGMLGLSCYILADTFFISKGMGADGLTALNLAIPVYSFIHGSGLMIGIGGATRYSLLKNGSSRQAMDLVFSRSVLYALGFSCMFVFAGIFFPNQLSRLLGADANVHQMTSSYLQVILVFAPAFMMNNVLLAFIRNDGNPRLSMLAMITGSLSNIVLDYLFIFPMGMGIFGAALATGFAPLISIAISVPISWETDTIPFEKSGAIPFLRFGHWFFGSFRFDHGVILRNCHDRI
ncbi:MAG: MATE family efflux transporter [Lachnospiraceae bacterium]